ncbi:MAG: ABC transporter ATP-binding protein [Candidatus Heimdallarchaeota archaeon]|nr:MAG: ABC transporter ATP-binding protein [Candidatus Heimdallarchaeota archaeon]
MDTETVIETQNLWKIYRAIHQQVNAIHNVSIQIPLGKITCITGPSGSGKSTLLALIGLLTPPSRGHVLIEGEQMNDLSEIVLTKIRREKFGFIFQNQYLLPHFTALENVCIPLLSQDISHKDANSQAIKVLKQLDLESRLRFRVKELSGGEAQRVCLARALVNNPPILIADEPSSNIDSKLTDEFLQLILELQKTRTLTVIIASHDPQILEVVENEIKLSDGTVKIHD